MLERPSRERRTRTRRRGAVVRALLIGVILALSFLLGIAFARTLDERPEDSGTVTSVRTLTPLPQQGPIRTVTVTVTAP
jgi:O-antigen/teichoic acid export membrane protein